jgi:hypothetical protein
MGKGITDPPIKTTIWQLWLQAMSSLLIKPPPDGDAASLLPLVTQAEREDDDDAAAALVLLDNGQCLRAFGGTRRDYVFVESQKCRTTKMCFR